MRTTRLSHLGTKTAADAPPPPAVLIGRRAATAAASPRPPVRALAQGSRCRKQQILSRAAGRSDDDARLVVGVAS